MFTREDDRYRVQVFLPQGRELRTILAWDAEGHATLDPPLPHDAAREETLKLARVLKRGSKDRLSRWRPLDEG